MRSAEKLVQSFKPIKMPMMWQVPRAAESYSIDATIFSTFSICADARTTANWISDPGCSHRALWQLKIGIDRNRCARRCWCLPTNRNYPSVKNKMKNRSFFYFIFVLFFLLSCSSRQTRAPNKISLDKLILCEKDRRNHRTIWFMCGSCTGRSTYDLTVFFQYDMGWLLPLTSLRSP